MFAKKSYTTPLSLNPSATKLFAGFDLDVNHYDTKKPIPKQ